VQVIIVVQILEIKYLLIGSVSANLLQGSRSIDFLILGDADRMHSSKLDLDRYRPKEVANGIHSFFSSLKGRYPPIALVSASQATNSNCVISRACVKAFRQR
jgi:hypothetical protein